ncbi:unnamed protein product [Prunus armeniaca]|uniref:Uncharacterized protein n=1 Tax=Prunus armeniaca TaxID=36596 RepID=A0A6J5XGB6_PRUAR|nr:unnamed protein product [Prunus armeniaca]
MEKNAQSGHRLHPLAQPPPTASLKKVTLHSKTTTLDHRIYVTESGVRASSPQVQGSAHLHFETLENYLKLVANLQKVRTSSAVIWNTMDCLEQSSVAQIQQEFQVPIFTVGPFHKIATAASSSY